ncbi:MAG: hypothetical protein ACLUEK_08430 [Oscillospiraceae bacterium]
MQIVIGLRIGARLAKQVVIDLCEEGIARPHQAHHALPSVHCEPGLHEVKGLIDRMSSALMREDIELQVLVGPWCEHGRVAATVRRWKHKGRCAQRSLKEVSSDGG